MVIGCARGCGSVARCIGFTLLCLVPALIAAEELSAFKLTGIEGEAYLRALFDENDIAHEDLRTFKETRPSYEQGFFVLTHSYAYHPKFLQMDLGAGLKFLQSELDSSYGDNAEQDVLVELSGRFRFLEDKPYPVTFFFDRRNPTLSLRLTEDVVLKNTNYGVISQLRQPLLPFPLQFEASRHESEGDGLETVIDDTVDQLRLSAESSLGPDGSARLSYQYINLDSNSGSLSLPIQRTTTTSHTGNLDTRLRFGSASQFELVSSGFASVQDQSLIGGRTDLRISNRLRWDHSERLYSHYRYVFSDTDADQEGAYGTNHDGEAGVNLRINDRLAVAGAARASRSEGFAAEQDSYGAGFEASYEQELWIGALQSGYAFRYDYVDRKADTATFTVVGERLALAGTAPVGLGNEFVLASTVVVSNEGRTQIYLEGSDYRLSVVGGQVRIERLVGGNIADGASVLVDYAFESGGTFSYDAFNHELNASYRFWRYYDVYLVARHSDQSLSSGVPGITLNSLSSVQLGARADVPLRWGLRAGGEARFEEHDEDIAPFTQYDVNAYAETPLFFTPGTLRAFVRHARVYVEASPEDVDLLRYGLMVESRPFLRTRVALEYSHEKDTGGTIGRELDLVSLNATWQRRRLAFTLRGNLRHERQGEFERDNVSLRAELTRNF